jgi:hypothetical protein
MYPGAQAKIRPFIHTYPRASGKADRQTSRTRVVAALGPGGRIGSQQTHRWSGMDSNFRFRARCKRGVRRKSPASTACRRRSSVAAVGGHQLRRKARNLGTEPLSRAELEVRIHSAPAKSLQTISSSAAEPLTADDSNAAAS